MPMTLKIRKKHLTTNPLSARPGSVGLGTGIYNLRQLTHKGSGIDI